MGASWGMDMGALKSHVAELLETPLSKIFSSLFLLHQKRCAVKPLHVPSNMANNACSGLSRTSAGAIVNFRAAVGIRNLHYHYHIRDYR